MESSNDVLTLHSIDDISNISPETQFTQKDVQLDEEDLVTEEITLHSKHLHEVASQESSQKIHYSDEMEIPQESEHPYEQEFHDYEMKNLDGAQFEVEENRNNHVDKQLEGEETKMDDEQELHYDEMQIPHEEQFEVEQRKNDHNEGKKQQERQSLEGEEVHKDEKESPHDEHFEVQQVRKDNKEKMEMEEQKSPEEKQLQVEERKSQEESEVLEISYTSSSTEDIQQQEELAQVHEFDHKPSLALCHLVDSNTFHFHREVEREETNQQHLRHSRRCQKK